MKRSTQFRLLRRLQAALAVCWFAAALFWVFAPPGWWRGWASAGCLGFMVAHVFLSRSARRWAAWLALVEAQSNVPGAAVAPHVIHPRSPKETP